MGVKKDWLVVGLSDSEIFTIMTVERMVFTITNTITVVDLLNISIHNAKIKHGFLSFRLQFISFQEIFVGKLAYISYKFMQNYYSDGRAVYYRDSE